MPDLIFHTTQLQGLFVVERKPALDERGFFCRFFCQKEFAALGFGQGVAQINHTLTRHRGTVRGMHFQCAPHEETKFVSCLAGEVFDVAVDLRPQSSTYLKWHGEILSGGNARSMLIPKGFAHGFQTLTQDCELIYLHDEAHAPTFEGGVNALDPKLRIAWPMPIAQMSGRDRTLPIIHS